MAQTRFALEAFQQLNDRRNASAQAMDLGVLLMRSGQLAQAELLIAESTVESDQLDLPAPAAVGRIWHGTVLFKLGQRTKGLELLQLADLELRDQSVSLPHCWSLHALAGAQLAMGDLSEAATAAARLQEATRPVPPMWAQSLAISARIQLQLGKVAEALKLAQDSVRVWEEGLPSPERGIAPLHALATVLAAQGKRQDSVAAAQRGWALVEQMAAHFTQDATRLAFLRGDPLHAELVELAKGE